MGGEVNAVISKVFGVVDYESGVSKFKVVDSVRRFCVEIYWYILFR